MRSRTYYIGYMDALGAWHTIATHSRAYARRLLSKWRREYVVVSTGELQQ